ncbi:MAG: hypothetical protein KGN35_03135, partial [Betaproteobacteria bacterium]|nr:hypothetical protein [Betaproteobacteria bacterium]
MKQLKQPPSRIRYRLQQTFLPLSFLVVSSLSLAAEYDASEYEHLLSDANSKGFVRVLITLDDTVTLEDMESKRTSLKAALESKAHNVVTELGQNALSSGYWNNGLGQMGVYVNEAGLQVLAGSKIALAFTRDVTHVYRIKAADADGSFDAIENILLAN